jgi:hypothetical protein
MKKRVPFTEQDEDATDSVFHWKQKHEQAVDKWIRLDSLLTKVIRENEALKAAVAAEREACARLWQKDAYRYRFLRDRAWPFEFKGHGAEDADAAIDAAIDLARGEK